MIGNSSISFTLPDIWHAWIAFRRGKKPSRALREFEQDLESNLLRLCAELNSSRYVHGAYNHKIVNEKKRRDIYVAAVRDRVVHRLLYDYLVQIVDPQLDYDVWSSRAGKGLHRCLSRTQQLLKKHPTAWIWRADIAKFFDTVPHENLKRVIRSRIRCAKSLDLLDKIIDSYPLQLSVSQSVSQSVTHRYSYRQPNQPGSIEYVYE
jgi:RNA-directed DNA polymerase